MFYSTTYDVGSVAGMRHVKPAISVANAVLKYTKHTLLTGVSGNTRFLFMLYFNIYFHTIYSIYYYLPFHPSTQSFADISKTPSTPSPLDPRPSTLNFNFFIVFFYSSNSKIRETISGQCWLTACDAGLILAERLVYVLGRDTIRNI